jgi:N6-adenosine-specific RNA methylase IME4
MTPQQYRTILADPPWNVPSQRGSRSPDRYYPLMPVDEICALPVERLAAHDAHLWLWTTNGAIPAALRVIEAWGFSYRSCLTWAKPKLGLGIYLRNASEQLLFATCGRAPIQFRAQPTWLFAPVQEHSRKPGEAYEVIERCSPGPRLELFARRRRPGWDAWGNELTTSDVEL